MSDVHINPQNRLPEIPDLAFALRLNPNDVPSKYACAKRHVREPD